MIFDLTYFLLHRKSLLLKLKTQIKKHGISCSDDNQNKNKNAKSIWSKAKISQVFNEW